MFLFITGSSNLTDCRVEGREIGTRDLETEIENKRKRGERQKAIEVETFCQ